ncbi:MAG: hypothetical protein AAB697_03030 [Patescibacteria group bacterium]
MADLTVLVYQILALMLAVAVAIVVVMVSGYLLVLWYRHRDREEKSLDMIALQVAVPRDNEIKIDAMEQVFAGLYSIQKRVTGTFWVVFFFTNPTPYFF